MRRVVGIGIAVAAAGAIGLGAYVFATRTSGAARVPTSRVVAGSLRLDVRATGELRPERIVPLSAPAAGSNLRLIRLAETGTAVKANDVVMEFDPADQLYLVEQTESDLAEVDQQIARMRADQDAQAAQDQVDLLTARFDVRRTELDARVPVRLITAVDSKKRGLAAEDATRRLAQLEHDIQNRNVSSKASLAVIVERRSRSRLSVERAQQIIDSLIVRAPIDGVVVVKENRDAIGGRPYPGMVLPEYRPGDSVPSGRALLDIAAAGTMEIRIKVNEQERPNIAAGQAARVTADALPGRAFEAHITSIAGFASRANDMAGPLRQFDVTLKLDQPVERLRAGTTVRVVITGSEIRNVLTIPRQALFQRNGKPIVYVRAGDRFEPREVKPTHRSESRVAVQGLREGDEVALVNPDVVASGPAAGNGGPLPAGGGPR
jgi:multidrug resistance efflux pump